jgi:hypothetical protein
MKTYRVVDAQMHVFGTSVTSFRWVVSFPLLSFYPNGKSSGTQWRSGNSCPQLDSNSDSVVRSTCSQLVYWLSYRDHIPSSESFRLKPVIPGCSVLAYGRQYNRTDRLILSTGLSFCKKNAAFWDVIYVSEERIASIIRMERISELGTTPAVTSNRSTLSGNSRSILINYMGKHFHLKIFIIFLVY